MEKKLKYPGKMIYEGEKPGSSKVSKKTDI
jgi:hypothetical protein